MRRRSAHRRVAGLRLALCAALSLLAGSAGAAELYDVEVLVFAQATSLQDERWPESEPWIWNAETPLLLLRPDPLQEWHAVESDIEPEAEESPVELDPLLLDSSSLGPLPDDPERPDPEQPSAAGIEADIAAIGDVGIETGIAGADFDDALNADEVEPEEDTEEPPPPPVELWQQRSPLELADSADRLQRRGYRVLWHRRWSQQINERNPGLYIVAQSADMGVQGWLKFSRQRYIHFATNLLASRQREDAPADEANDARQGNEPDRLGDSPGLNESRRSDDPDQDQQNDKRKQGDEAEEAAPEDEVPDGLNQRSVIASLSAEAIPMSECSVALAPAYSLVPAVDGAAGSTADDAAAEEGDAVSAPPEYAAGDCLLARGQLPQSDETLWRTWPFGVSRRMQSGETHYLDHPLLGIIVRVSRHSPERD